MDKFEKMAKEARITEGASDLKYADGTPAGPLWYFVFEGVEDAPCTMLGEHAPTSEEAIPLVAKRLKELANEA